LCFLTGNISKLSRGGDFLFGYFTCHPVILLATASSFLLHYRHVTLTERKAYHFRTNGRDGRIDKEIEQGTSIGQLEVVSYGKGGQNQVVIAH
jgi:hypothetical protein